MSTLPMITEHPGVVCIRRTTRYDMFLRVAHRYKKVGFKQSWRGREWHDVILKVVTGTT